MVLTAISAVVMPFLGWAKLRTATALGSGALRADAYETITCSWLSLATFAGLILNAAFGFCLGCEMYLLIKRLRPGRQGMADPESDKEVAV